MYMPTWGPEILTGNPQIDAEHQELLSRLDALMTAITLQREAPVIQETLTYLNQYAAKHFAEEEALHQAAHAPNFDGHSAAHRLVVKELSVLLDLYRQEGLSPRVELHLVNHVIRGFIAQLHDYDLALAKHIQQTEEKHRPKR